MRHRCLGHKPPIEAKPLDQWEFRRGTESRSVRAPHTLVTDDREGLIDAALAGGGLLRIGMVNPALITSGRLRRVLTDWECPGAPAVYVYYRRSAKPAPKVAAFLEFLSGAIAAFDPDNFISSWSLSPKGI